MVKDPEETAAPPKAPGESVLARLLGDNQPFTLFLILILIILSSRP